MLLLTCCKSLHQNCNTGMPPDQFPFNQRTHVMLDMLDVATHRNTDTWLSENHLVFDEISIFDSGSLSGIFPFEVST